MKGGFFLQKLYYLLKKYGKKFFWILLFLNNPEVEICHAFNGNQKNISNLMKYIV